MITNRLQYYLNLWELRKLINVLKNLSSYYLSKYSGKYFVWGQPFTFFIEPTNLCNLRCPECPVGLCQLKRKQGFMDLDHYKAVIDDISSYAWYLLLYFQGESAIHPRLIDMINYAYQKNIYTEISTNGTRLGEKTFAGELAASNLGKLIVSLDGASEATYKIYRRGGLFKRVIKGIEYLVAARENYRKKTPEIVLQFIVMHHNEHEMKQVKNLGKSLGVDSVLFKSPQIYNFEHAEQTLPQNPRYRRYRKVNGQYVLKGEFSGYCKKLWIGSVITQDRLVIPCCFDKDANHILGSLTAQRFEDVWKSGAYHAFRQQVLTNRQNVEICKNCSEGLKTLFN